jgi:hypothetical protein
MSPCEPVLLALVLFGPPPSGSTARVAGLEPLAGRRRARLMAAGLAWPWRRPSGWAAG